VPKRPPGRPRDDVQRTALINETLRLLQTTPPSNLTRLDIARAAGVDPALIRYYFGDKYKLFAEVIAVIAAEIETGGSAALASAGTPKERIARLVRSSHEVHRRYPHYHQLILDQIIHGHPEAVQRIRAKMSGSLREGLLNLMREGETSGELRVVDPGHLAIAIIGMCEYYSSGWGPVAALLGESTEDARDKSAQLYGQFIEELIVRSLAP
jgi:AcrR family transcriptional regulator